jgi:hypothetical protein
MGKISPPKLTKQRLLGSKSNVLRHYVSNKLQNKPYCHLQPALPSKIGSRLGLVRRLHIEG